MVHLGWRNALMLTSVVAPALVLTWLLYATDRPFEHRAVNAREFEIIASCGETRSNAIKLVKHLSASWKLVLKSGQSWRLFTAYGCQNYLGYVFIWWGYIYLVEARHFSLMRSGFVIAAPFILGTIATPSVGALSDRLTARLDKRRGRRLVPVLAMIISAILVFAGSRIADDRLAVALLSVGAALCWTPEGSTWASTMEIASPVAGTAVGFVNTGGNLELPGRSTDAVVRQGDRVDRRLRRRQFVGHRWLRRLDGCRLVPRQNVIHLSLGETTIHNQITSPLTRTGLA